MLPEFQDHTPSQPSPLDTSRFRKVESKPDVIKLKAKRLNHHVIGQEEAGLAVARELVIAEANMSDPTKPKGVYMFTGPTGVGKTEMSIAIAKDLYGDAWENHYKIIDCNILSTKGDVSRLTGTSAGWVGYGDEPLITPDFLNQPDGTVVVFDEIEKAYPEVWQALLSVTGRAKLPVFISEKNNRRTADAKATELAFSNTIVIFTSNAGSEQMHQARTGSKTMGFGKQNSTSYTLREAAKKGLKEVFSTIPEFLGRIGENRMIVFRELGYDDYVKIFDLILAKTNNRISGEIMVTDALKTHVINQAIGTGEYGARDLETFIRDHVIATTAEHRAGGSVVPTTEVLLDLVDGEIVAYEGYEIPPKQVMQRREEPLTPLLPVDKRQLHIAYGTSFTLDIPQRASSQENTSYHIELTNDDNALGTVKVREAKLENTRTTLENIRTTIVYPSGKLYTFQLELSGSNRQNPPDIKMQLDDKLYTAKIAFLPKTDGRHGRQQICRWQREENTNDLVEFALSWEDMKKATFVISEATGTKAN